VIATAAAIACGLIASGILGYAYWDLEIRPGRDRRRAEREDTNNG
jgi:hypothetical protein